MARKYKVTVTSNAEIPLSEDDEVTEENIRELIWYGFRYLMDESGPTPPDSLSFVEVEDFDDV